MSRGIPSAAGPLIGTRNATDKAERNRLDRALTSRIGVGAIRGERRDSMARQDGSQIPGVAQRKCSEFDGNRVEPPLLRNNGEIDAPR